MSATRLPTITAGRRAFLLSFVSLSVTELSAAPGAGRRHACQGAWSGRGSALVAPGSCRRRGDGTTARVRCLRSSRRHAVAATSSAAGGPIVSKAVASARCSKGERRGGVAAGDQVTVTDSHHPALWMAPACSSRRQCPRVNCTCCASQRRWPPRRTLMTLLPRMPAIVPPVHSSGTLTAAAHHHYG